MDETNEIEERLTISRDQVNAQRSIVGVASSDQMTIGELAPIVGANPPFFSSLRSVWQFSEIQRRVLIAEKAVADYLSSALRAKLCNAPPPYCRTRPHPKLDRRCARLRRRGCGLRYLGFRNYRDRSPNPCLRSRAAVRSFGLSHVHTL